MSLLNRLFPHPLLSVLLLIVYMLLINTITVGGLLMGLFLAIVIPALTAPYWPHRPKVTSVGRLVRYVMIVVYDIVKSNIEVAGLIVFKSSEDLKPAFISIPLDLKSPEAITILAGTITLTPGTVSADLAHDGKSLLVHCLHAPDPESVIDDIKTRYESRLKEIFA